VPEAAFLAAACPLVGVDLRVCPLVGAVAVCLPSGRGRPTCLPSGLANSVREQFGISPRYMARHIASMLIRSTRNFSLSYHVIVKWTKRAPGWKSKSSFLP